MKTLLTLLVSASFLMGAGLPSTQIRGAYVEARTADVFTGPCFANSEVELVGDLAVFGWKVSTGTFDGVKLDGLGVVAAIKASATLGDYHHSSYPVKSVLIIDEKANPEQRIALQNFAKRMSKDLLHNIVRVEYAPVTLEFENNDVHTSKATMKAGKLAAIETRPIINGDHLCSNELVWYQPLTDLEHAMPAYAIGHSFKGDALGTTWSSPDKRSAFVGTFQFNGD